MLRRAFWISLAAAMLCPRFCMRNTPCRRSPRPGTGREDFGRQEASDAMSAALRNQIAPEAAPTSMLLERQTTRCARTQCLADRLPLPASP